MNIKDSILSLSNRTIQKIIARASLSCSICNWNLARGDIHHIIETSKGGSNDMDNLIYVCPNCHRCIHQLGEDFKTVQELKNLSLDKTFSNWRDFYNISSSSKLDINSSYTKHCLYCNDLIPDHRKFCNISCGTSYHNERQRKEKYSESMLIEILKKHNGILTKCGNEVNISDNAFKKQCIKFNIDYKSYKIKYIREKSIMVPNV